MNNNKPVQLSQKIQYLHEKINAVHHQIIQSGFYDSKMKFIAFVDATIEKIYNLDTKQPAQKYIAQKTYQSSFKSQYNQREKNRIQRETFLLAQRLKQLHQKEKAIEIERLKIEIENAKIIKQKMNKGYQEKQKELKQYIFSTQKKLKSVQKQLQRLIKLNAAQAKEIDMVKQERNKAEKNHLEWRQKYQTQISMIEKFSTNKQKYAFRNSDGIRINRIFTNITTAKKGCQRLVVIDLPLKFQVLKIVFGIKIGVISIDKQIEYLNEVVFYENQSMNLRYEQGTIMLQYIKRKIIVKLQKYKVVNNQMVIMLFGKGDSVSLDESQ